MKKLSRNDSSPLYVPDYVAKSLADVDFDILKKRGVKYIAFDADATLVTYRAIEIDPETKKLLKQNRKKFVNWCVASNRITNDLLPLAKSMDAQVVRASLFTRKPSKRFYKWVIDHFGSEPGAIAMIGDKLIADMYGAKRAGLVTVWVKHLGNDSKHDKLLMVRNLENWLMKKYLDE